MISYITTHISSTEYEIFAIFPVLQNRQFMSDRDETLTRHDFRPWFIRVLSFEPLAQSFIPNSRAQSTLYQAGKTDRRIDRRTDGQTDKLNPISPRFHGGY